MSRDSPLHACAVDRVFVPRRRTSRRDHGRICVMQTRLDLLRAALSCAKEPVASTGSGFRFIANRSAIEEPIYLKIGVVQTRGSVQQHELSLRQNVHGDIRSSAYSLIVSHQQFLRYAESDRSVPTVTQQYIITRRVITIRRINWSKECRLRKQFGRQVRFRNIVNRTGDMFAIKHILYK